MVSDNSIFNKYLIDTLVIIFCTILKKISEV